LMPGTYSLASGETFPLRSPRNVEVVATEGRAVTFLDAASKGAVRLDHGSLVSGVSLTTTGPRLVDSFLFPGSLPPAGIRDCDLIGGGTAIKTGHVHIESSRFIGQTSNAIEIYAGGIVVEDSEFVGGGAWHALDGYFQYYDSHSASVELTRCKLSGYGSAAIRFGSGPSPGHVELTVRDSLIVDNQGGGIRTVSPSGYSVVELTLDGCTIANNGSFGVDRAYSSAPMIHSSIIAGHAEDLRGGGPIESSLVADGSGGAGALSGDPRFVDAANGDYSLRFDSPCLDAAELGQFRRDLFGRVRAVDSDLDLQPRADIGAIEHATLMGPETTTVGDPFELGVTGPAGGFSTIIVSPAGYASAGASTIFGRLFLEPHGSFRIVPALTTGGGPTMVNLSAVLDPAWVGTSVGFQALPRSFNAPAGGAFSNPILVEMR
ncbi:MAG: right-handed parallel beta-helix repeat-containing protein, partial [Planctomycetota bacterium]